jgi:hypothetical protein
MTEREAEIAALVQDMSGFRRVWPDMALYQDIGMVGDDITEFVMALEERYGEWVWEWPWQRFAELNEGLGCLFLPGLIWQLLTWPFRGSFNYLSKLERLEISHIAAVIDKGEWFEP